LLTGKQQPVETFCFWAKNTLHWVLILLLVSYFDIIILIPLLWAGYRGFTKGVIIEVVSILAFVLGIWGAIHFSDYIAEYVIDNINRKYEPVISFSIIFVGIVIGVFVIGKLLEKIVNLAQLKLANKIAGAAFGVGKIVLILSFLVIIVNQYDAKFKFIPKEVKEESLLYNPLIDLSKKVVPAVEDSDTFKEKNRFMDLFSTEKLFANN
jgi:membrane protein required for colicin V production